MLASAGMLTTAAGRRGEGVMPVWECRAVGLQATETLQPWKGTFSEKGPPGGLPLT